MKFRLVSPVCPGWAWLSARMSTSDDYEGVAAHKAERPPPRSITLGYGPKSGVALSQMKFSSRRPERLV
jgi:hypothetical protein